MSWVRRRRLKREPFKQGKVNRKNNADWGRISGGWKRRGVSER